MDNVFLFRYLETENKINNDHEYINILKDIPDLDGYLKIYNKKYSIFKNFVDTGRFRKFRKQFCEKNGISLLFDDRDVILKIPDYNDSRCIDYCIKAPIYLYNLTLFELSYIVRLSMILGAFLMSLIRLLLQRLLMRLASVSNLSWGFLQTRYTRMKVQGNLARLMSFKWGMVWD
jgi:hypothetical protein